MWHTQLVNNVAKHYGANDGECYSTLTNNNLSRGCAYVDYLELNIRENVTHVHHIIYKQYNVTFYLCNILFSLNEERQIQLLHAFTNTPYRWSSADVPTTNLVFTLF